MTQHVGHLLERAATIEQARRYRVAQRMSTTMCETDASKGVADHAPHGIDTDRLISRCQTANEDRRVGGLRALVAQVVGERMTGERRQRQDILTTGLGAPERHGTVAPVDVGELQLGHFAAAQPHVQRTAHMA